MNYLNLKKPQNFPLQNLLRNFNFFCIEYLKFYYLIFLNSLNCLKHKNINKLIN